MPDKPNENTPQGAKGATPSLWDGVTFRNKDYKPARFSHLGRSYVWKELTRTDVERLASDPRFTLFKLAEKK